MQVHRVLAAAALLCGGIACAQPTLTGAAPADRSEGASPPRIELRFSEPLRTRQSAAQLVMTGMPGMADHPPMGMAVTVAAGPDPHTMLLTPDQPLPPGSYRVDWRAVGADRRPATGSIGFLVK